MSDDDLRGARALVRQNFPFVEEPNIFRAVISAINKFQSQHANNSSSGTILIGSQISRVSEELKCKTYLIGRENRVNHPIMTRMRLEATEPRFSDHVMGSNCKRALLGEQSDHHITILHHKPH